MNVGPGGTLLRLVVGLGCALVAATAAITARADPLPFKLLWQPPNLENAELSPNGRFVAAVQEDQRKVSNVVIIDLATNDIKRLPGSATVSFRQVRWLDDDRLIAFGSSGNALSLYLVPRAAPADRYPVFGLRGLNVIGFPRDRPEHAIVSYHSDRPSHPLILGEIDLTQKLSENYLWEASIRLDPVSEYPLPDRETHDTSLSFRDDLAGELAVAIWGREDERAFLRFDRSQARWLPVQLDPTRNRLIAAEPDDETWWVATDASEGGTQLGRYHAAANTWDTPIWHDPEYDLRSARLYFSPANRQVVGYSLQGQRLTSQWLDERYALAQQAVAQKNPGQDQFLQGVSTDENRFLFLSYHGATRGQLVLVDLQQRAVTTVAALSPELDQHALSIPKAVKFKARDGTRLDGFLTLPAHLDRAAPPALIVLVDGQRTAWNFHPWVHWFVSRGFAVLQINDRSTTPLYQRDRDDDELKLTQVAADHIDAVRQASRSGLIDPRRIAIFGVGWGGYLAMLTTAEAPDLFAASLSVNAMYDWQTTLRRARPFLGDKELARIRTQLVGSEESVDLDDLSPSRLADRFVAPVFLAGPKLAIASTNYQQAKFAAALRRHDIPVESYIGKIGRDGGFDETAEVGFFLALETFLQSHLAH